MKAAKSGWWKTIRRLFARNEWSVRWFGLPRGPESTETGLIMVQIDGLAYAELEIAIRERRMPFVASLLRRDHYRLHSMYSGMPSSTPAVQGELFYGIECAVPAFGFRERETGNFVRMFSPGAADRVQQILEVGNERLLTGGSAYCDIYDGGATESHFCAASFGWGHVFAPVNPIRLVVGWIAYGGSLIRAFGLATLEIWLAVAGFLKRDSTRREFWQELLMVPARVVVAVLMRELSVIGGAMDAARGLPIIHINMLGYDEHAHRRGPRSKFAHWTLRGIDQAIRRLSTASKRSTRRRYDLWIYSDHGQETTIPYQYLSGQTIQESCKNAYEEIVTGEALRELNRQNVIRESVRSSAPDRATWLTKRPWLKRSFPEPAEQSEVPDEDEISVTAIGPIGHAYLNKQASRSDHELKGMLAERLVQHHQVPMVCYLAEGKTVVVVTLEGVYELPGESVAVFGEDHPFIDVVANDFCCLCRHPDAGDLVLGGWALNQEAVTFVMQHGAHGGGGSVETHAFVMLPRTVKPQSAKAYLRPAQLRDAALRHLGRSSRQPVDSTQIESKVATIN